MRLRGEDENLELLPGRNQKEVLWRVQAGAGCLVKYLMENLTVKYDLVMCFDVSSFH